MSLLVSLGRSVLYCAAMATYKQRLGKLFGIKSSQVAKLYGEINNSSFMAEIVREAGIRKGFFDFSMASVLRAPTLYALCRILRPEILVETGVANGFSSTFILKALEANGKGKLYSIDLPNQPGQELKNNRTTGWLVPEGLKKRWVLILGSSREKLPPLLTDLRKVDLFYHDSDHSYENMMFEFKEVLSYSGKNSLIVADDITDNSAFRDFSQSIPCRSLALFKLGIIKNE